MKNKKNSSPIIILFEPQLEENIGAVARAAGFTRSFGRFESLRKAGLDQKGARQLYQTAGTYQALGQQTGTEIDIGTLESAAVGDIDATKQVGLLTAEA